MPSNKAGVTAPVITSLSSVADTHKSVMFPESSQEAAGTISEMDRIIAPAVLASPPPAGQLNADSVFSSDRQNANPQQDSREGLIPGAIKMVRFHPDASSVESCLVGESKRS